MSCKSKRLITAAYFSCSHIRGKIATSVPALQKNKKNVHESLDIYHPMKTKIPEDRDPIRTLFEKEIVEGP
jgi:hypothetical protein